MQSTRVLLRGAWVPPATALLVGCVAALFLPIGVGVIIATVLPLCALAVTIGLLVVAVLSRLRPRRRVEISLFVMAWLISSLLVTVLARALLYVTGVSVSRQPFIQRVLLDLLATAPLNALLIAVMIVATVVVTRRATDEPLD